MAAILKRILSGGSIWTSLTFWIALVGALLSLCGWLSGIVPPEWQAIIGTVTGVLVVVLRVLKTLNPTPAPDPNVPTTEPSPIDIPGLPPFVSTIIKTVLAWIQDGIVDTAKAIAPAAETRAVAHKMVDDAFDRAEEFAKAKDKPVLVTSFVPAPVTAADMQAALAAVQAAKQSGA